jgi:hypothetical protein
MQPHQSSINNNGGQTRRDNRWPGAPVHHNLLLCNSILSAHPCTRCTGHAGHAGLARCCISTWNACITRPMVLALTSHESPAGLRASRTLGAATRSRHRKSGTRAPHLKPNGKENSTWNDASRQPAIISVLLGVNPHRRFLVPRRCP